MTAPHTFALVDCNNFYVSCERLFRPDLRQRPVIVLSNNDGCVVSRSAEAKALGIGMAVPAYQIRHIIERENVVVFSSNYTLYADISSRVMATLESFADAMEIYSIDEAFLDFSSMGAGARGEAFARHIQQTVARHTGIQVSIGIAPTKTLAKLANLAAKKYPATGGVVDLRDPERQHKLLKLVAASDVWNVGRRTSRKLEVTGIETAWQLACADPVQMRKRFSITVSRAVHELNGVSCYELTDVRATRRQVLCSRSFGSPVTNLESLELAVSEYASRAAEKLREEGLLAGVVSVFVRTNHHNSHVPQYSNSATGELLHPTADTRHILERSLALLRAIWKDRYQYVKAGVWLAELQPQASYQHGLFEDAEARSRSQSLMAALDHINRRGEHIWFAAKGAGMDRHMRREHVSPASTTRWADIPKAQAK